MIGKDMTKMTLPVSFNEPTSLLQRVTEDMVCPFLSFNPEISYDSHDTSSKTMLQQQSGVSVSHPFHTFLMHLITVLGNEHADCQILTGIH